MLVCCVMSGVQVYLAVNNELKSQREQILSSFTTEVASNFDRSMETCRNSILSVIGDRKVSSTLNYVTDSYYQQYEDLKQTLFPAVSLVKLQAPELKSLTIYSGNTMLNHQNNAIQPLEIMDDKFCREQPSEKKTFYWAVDNGNVSAVYHLMKPSKKAVDNYVVGVIGTAALMRIGDGRIYEGDFFLTDQEGNVLLPLEKSSFEAGTEDRIVKDGGIREITSVTGRYYLVGLPAAELRLDAELLIPQGSAGGQPQHEDSRGNFEYLNRLPRDALILTRVVFPKVQQEDLDSLNKAVREDEKGNFDVIWRPDR